MEVIYISIGDEYILDEKHIVVKKVTKVYHMTNFYVSNILDEQEESDDDEEIFDLG